MKKILLFLILVLGVQFSMAQQDSIVKFHGKILSSEGFVYNVNVVNKKIFKGTVSDMQGNFALPVKRGDVITFSSIGYKDYTYTIPDSIKGNDYRVIVQMVVDTVQIGATIITPWPLKNEFRRVFLEEKPKDEKEIIATYAGFREIEGDPTEPPPTILNPISFIAKLFSKKRIQQKKMERMRKILQEK